MTTAAKVTDYIISKGVKEGNLLTNKRIQKLIYYIQAWHLAINNKPIFDDTIEAWVHGPAIRSIYEMYRANAWLPISKVANPKIADELEPDTVQFIDRIFLAYSKYDTATLEYMTHAETPWQEARKGLEANEISSNEITQDSMKEYYAKRLVSTE